jgi:hypothetical protein
LGFVEYPLLEAVREGSNTGESPQHQATHERVDHGLATLAQQLAGVAGSIEDLCERVRGRLAEATFEQKRKLVELLIDRVIVTGEEVEIRYVIPTNPSSEQVRFCHLRSDYLHHPSPRRMNLGRRVVLRQVLAPFPSGIDLDVSDVARRSSELPQVL